MATLCHENLFIHSFLHLCYTQLRRFTLHFATFPGKIASPWPEWDEFRDIFDKLYPEHMEHEGPRGVGQLLNAEARTFSSTVGTVVREQMYSLMLGFVHRVLRACIPPEFQARPPKVPQKKINRGAFKVGKMNESSLPVSHPVRVTRDRTYRPPTPCIHRKYGRIIQHLRKLFWPPMAMGIASTVMLSSACHVSANPHTSGNVAAPLTRKR